MLESQASLFHSAFLVISKICRPIYLCTIPVLSPVFVLQEYTSENIDWTRVDFEDNQECLDLIEKVL
jgi:hypothetical protein